MLEEPGDDLVDEAVVVKQFHLLIAIINPVINFKKVQTVLNIPTSKTNNLRIASI